MSEHINEIFIRDLNQNIGIAHKICRIYGSQSDEREDLLQEMIYQLWRSYPTFKNGSKFSTWMYRVCLNTALTYLKKNNKGQRESIESKHTQIAEYSYHSEQEDIKQLYQAIEFLSPSNKAIILLYLEDLTYEEIATITGLTKSNVSVRLVRIKKELENKIKTLKHQ